MNLQDTYESLMSEFIPPKNSRPPFAESGRYDPNSPNAMWAMILIKMETMDKTMTAEGLAVRKIIADRMDANDLANQRIEKQVNETNGRVTLLEKWREAIGVKTSTLVMVLGVAGGFIGWLVNLILSYLASK